MPDPTLYVDSPVQTFSADDAAPFREVLRAQDRFTVVTPVDRFEQLTLAPDGTTQRGGYRLSPVAFRQLCRAVSPGLYDAASHVAGLRRTEGTDRDTFSVPDAIAMVNIAVRRRYRACLDGLQIVRDGRTGVVEGLIGRGYRRLPNFELFERAVDTLRSYRHPATFSGANLQGRYAVLHFRYTDAMFAAPAPRDFSDQLCWGFYFCNSEIGDGSLRATNTVVRLCDDTRSLAPFGSRGRLTHAGRDFARRFEQLLNNVADRRPDPERTRAGVVRLIGQSLGFTENEAEIERRFNQLVDRLVGRKLNRSAARRVVRRVMTQGSYDRSAVSDVRYVSRSDWAARTLYDFYCAMIRTAVSFQITVRERVEQLAYALLTGRFNVQGPSDDQDTE